MKPPHRITADDWIFQAMSEIESADELQKLCLHFIQQLTADYKKGLIRNFVPPRANKHAFFSRYKTFRANAFFSLLTYILRIGTWHFIIAALFHFCTSNQKKRSVACLEATDLLIRFAWSPGSRITPAGYFSPDQDWISICRTGISQI